MARITWVTDEDAQGEVAALFARIRDQFRGRVPDIMRTMSLRPDFLAAFLDMQQLHFSDGALTRAQHEMIASYVSALNRCHY